MRNNSAQRWKLLKVSNILVRLSFKMISSLFRMSDTWFLTEKVVYKITITNVGDLLISMNAMGIAPDIMGRERIIRCRLTQRLLISLAKNLLEFWLPWRGTEAITPNVFNYRMLLLDITHQEEETNIYHKKVLMLILFSRLPL